MDGEHMRRRALWLANLLLPKHREPIGRIHALQAIIGNPVPKVRRCPQDRPDLFYRPPYAPVSIASPVDTEDIYEFAVRR